MFINLLENPELIFGAARVIADEDGLHLLRMTGELEEFYNYSEPAVTRVACTSGIRIAFVTDSEILAFGVRFGRHCREFFRIDVIIDGMTCLSFGPDEFQEDYVFTTELPDGDKKVEIYLSHCVEVILTALEVADDATVIPCPETDREIIFIGDSITQGMTVHGASDTYPALLSAELEVNFRNIAVGGASMRGEVGELALALDWDDAVVAFGINDFNQARPLADITADTSRMLKALTSREDATIYLLTPIPWAERTEPNDLGLSVQDYRDAIAAAAKDFPTVTVIDGNTLVPNDSAYYIDNIHPNEDGAEAYAENLLKYLSK
jgi:lysophospholipase L1-like esterase